MNSMAAIDGSKMVAWQDLFFRRVVTCLNTMGWKCQKSWRRGRDSCKGVSVTCCDSRSYVVKSLYCLGL